MVFLRGVEAALGIVLLVDLIKTAVPSILRSWVKLTLVAIFATAGAWVLTPGENWRAVAGAAMVAAGLAPVVHEMHALLSINVDRAVRQVVQQIRNTGRRVPPAL